MSTFSGARPVPARTAESAPVAAGRLLAAGLAGAVGWAAIGAALPAVPVFVRFVVTLLVFVVGSGSVVAGWFVDDLATADQAIVLAAFGVGFAPAFADVLARARMPGVVPYVAGAGVGLLIERVMRRRGAALAAHDGWAWIAAAIAAGTGAIVFAHRLTAADGITVFGDYDSVDLTYYASITAELSHRVPPLTPFYSGHPLNYSWYPHLLLALLHRYGHVPILDLYFRYAWPAFLTLGALAGYVFLRSIASRGVALLGLALLLLGGDFSYIFVWALRPTTYLFDWLLWPTNFLAATMEVLHFSTWTPSLPVFFVGLFALARAEQPRHRIVWVVLAAAAFALLVEFKPFAYAVLLAALGAVVLFSSSEQETRIRSGLTLALSVLFAAPFFYQIVTLYAESRGHLQIDYFLLQRTMLDKFALTDGFNRAASLVASSGGLHTIIVLTAATALFFVGGLGVRWIGVAGVWRAIALRPDERPIWQLLGWIVVAGAAIPFVIVTDPYHDTLQFYQTGLLVLWFFAARAIFEWEGSRSARGMIIAAALALAVPSPIHYLLEKSGDGPNHPLAHMTQSEIAVANYLRQQDPERTVLLHDRPADPSLFVILSERRTVLAWSAYVRGSAVARREVDRVFASADREPSVAFDVLRQYRVTHLINRPDRDRVNPAVLAGLKPIFRFPDVELYEVPPGVQ